MAPIKPLWTAPSLLAGCALFGFAVLTTLATVLNNAYSFGATFFDSTIFQTIIWRSGPALRLPESFGGLSFLHTHLSPINEVPNLLSYLVPVDRMVWYGLVYGVVDGFLLLAVFILLRAQGAGRVLPAFAGTLLFYCCGAVAVGRFEPHQETASTLFMVAFFAAWAFRRPGWMLAMLVLNATVREDCGLLLAFPLALLAGHAAWRGEAQEARRLAGLALLSSLLSLLAIAAKQAWFTRFDVLSAVYYPPWPNSFAHLSAAVLRHRVHLVLVEAQSLWLPGLALCLAALWRRDARLAIGFAAFVPFWVFNFFSLLDLNVTLGSYKSFPLVLMLVWPAILAIRGGGGRALALVQVVVLVVGCWGWADGGVRFAAATGIEALKSRWLLRPQTEQAQTYGLLEPRFGTAELGLTRVSMGVLALYPYSFEHFVVSEVQQGKADGAPYLQSLVWFQGDRDQPVTDAYLAQGGFPYRYSIPGTKLRIASRRPRAALPGFAPFLEPAAP